MKARYIAIASIFFIPACGPGSQPPSVTETVAVPLTESPLAPPTQTFPTEPAPDPNYFRDDFDARLGAGWEWLNEDPPTADFQFAGLVAYESVLNYIQAGRAFCEGLPSCAGDGLYIDYYQNGEFILPNFAEPYTEGDETYLRLVCERGTYVFHTSSDGNEWTLRGGQASAGLPLKIGLLAGQNSGDPIPALYDYFEVRSLE